MAATRNFQLFVMCVVFDVFKGGESDDTNKMLMQDGHRANFI